MEWVRVPSPIGDLGVSVVAGAVRGVSFGVPVEPPVGARVEPGAEATLAEARRELAEYFAGDRMDFRVPYIFRKGSDFERAVWAVIAAIPYGETMSYGAVARAVGEPGGAQAVGTACNHNPVPIIVPCHRVIGSDGKLVGFGGGLQRKQFLLSLEARVHIERVFSGELP
jgi:methylated-DNA-[protein]-cysteine S-methyltransferase